MRRRSPERDSAASDFLTLPALNTIALTENHAESEPASRRAAAAGSTRRRRLAIAVVIVAVLLIGLRLVLPFALVTALPGVAEEQLGVRLELGAVELSLSTGELIVSDLRMDPLRRPGEVVAAEATDPLVSLRHGRLAIAWWPLLSNRLHVRSAIFESYSMHVVQDSSGRWRVPLPISQMILSEDDSAPDAELEVEAEPGNPWTFDIDRLQIDDLTLRLALDGRGEVARFVAGAIKVDEIRVAPDSLQLGEIAVQQPGLRVEHAWLAARAGAQAEDGLGDEGGEGVAGGEATPAEDDPFRFGVAGFRIETGTIVDRTAFGPLEVGLRLEVGGFALRPGATAPLDFELTLGEGVVRLDGVLGVEPVSFDGRLTWRQLPLRMLAGLRRPSLLPWLSSGRSEGELNLRLALRPESGSSGLALDGSLAIRALALEQPEPGELAVAWGELDVRFDEVFIPLGDSDAPVRLGIGDLKLAAPRVRITRPFDAVSELQQALAGAPAGEEPGATAADAGGGRAAVDWSIGALAVTEGDLVFAQRDPLPAQQTRIHELRVTGSDLAFDGRLHGRLEVFALAQESAGVTLSYARVGDDADLTFAVRELRLVPFDAVVRSQGIGIASGGLSLETTGTMRGLDYRLDNRLILHEPDLAFRDAAPLFDQLGMSPDLALALLKGPKGNVRLRIPIHSEEGLAKVELGAVITKAVQSSVTGALTTPLKLIGAFIPGRGEKASFEPVASEPGRAQLLEDEGDRVEPLADLLKDRPALLLELHGQTGPGDHADLVLDALADRVAAGERLPSIDGAGRLTRRRISSALRSRAGGKRKSLSESDQALLYAWAETQVPEPERIAALALARSVSLRALLVDKGAPDEAVALGDARSGEIEGVVLELRARPR